MLDRFRNALDRKKAGESGFTLIELLVVVLILGILSGIVVVAVSNARTQAVNKSCLANRVVLLKALDSYAVDPANLGYPTATGSSGTYTPGDLAVLVPTYLHNLPPYATNSPAIRGNITPPVDSDYALLARYVAASGGVSEHIEIYSNMEDRCPALGVAA